MFVHYLKERGGSPRENGGGGGGGIDYVPERLNAFDPDTQFNKF